MSVARALTTRVAAGAATSLVAAALVAGATGPARAASKVDYGTESLSKAIGRTGSCAKAASGLISAMQRDYYLRSTAFLRISSIRTVATNIVTTAMLPSGAASFTITEKARCSGTATRRGMPGSVPIWFTVDYAPDFTGLTPKQLRHITRAPASTYSVSYQTATDPGWSTAS